ncbi:unnamed protein product, partial [Ectocarpus sp. 4 AP-2014]
RLSPSVLCAASGRAKEASLHQLGCRWRVWVRVNVLGVAAAVCLRTHTAAKDRDEPFPHNLEDTAGLRCCNGERGVLRRAEFDTAGREASDNVDSKGLQLPATGLDHEGPVRCCC